MPFGAIAAGGAILAIMAAVIFGPLAQLEADNVARKSERAVIDHMDKDELESAKQIAVLQTRIAATNAVVQPVIMEIVRAPQTSTCGPSIDVAFDGVSVLYGNSDAR